MSHKSIFQHQLNISSRDLHDFDEHADVFFLELPFFQNNKSHFEHFSSISNSLEKIQNIKRKNITICILCSPVSALEILNELEKTLFFKLSVSIKLCTPIKREGYIASAFGTLLVFTNYKHPLRHTKTRIAYTYCPSCRKTTKDYGGKKHLFDSYGTIISDVWRDICWDISAEPKNIIERVRDLFSIDEYSSMACYSLRQNHYNFNSTDEPIFCNIRKSKNNLLKSGLILGDVLASLHNMPDNSIDYCFADPPYNLKKKYNDWNDGIDIKNYFSWCDKWLAELSRVLKPGGVLSIINIPQWAARHYLFLRDKLTLFDIITWEGLSMPVRMIMPANYTILCFSKGKISSALSLEASTRRLNCEPLLTIKEFFCSRSSCVKQRNINNDHQEIISNLWWDIHRLKHNSVRVDHPCQLPPTMMYRLISLFSRPGDIVLDPFNGSGTTTLAAQLLKRDYIGIELSEDYHTIAHARHHEIELGLDPFRKRTGSSDTKAKNSYVKRMPKIKYAVSKKSLQLEVKELALKLGRAPTEDDIAKHSSYPLEYFHQYFINWSEVTAATRTTGMSEFQNDDTRDTDTSNVGL